MEEFIKACANVGFPIAVASYLLIRIEGKMEALTNAMSSLTNAIDHMKTN